MNYENYGGKVMSMVTKCYQDICEMLNNIVGVGGEIEFSFETDIPFRSCERVDDIYVVDVKEIKKVKLVSNDTFVYQLEDDGEDYDNDDWFDYYESEIFALYDCVYNVYNMSKNVKGRDVLLADLDGYFAHIEDKEKPAVYGLPDGISVKLGDGYIKMIMRDKSAPESYRFVCFSDGDNKGKVYSVATSEIGTALLRDIITELKEKLN